MFHQGFGIAFDTRSFNLYAHMSLGYATLGLSNEKGVVTWKREGGKINDDLARILGRMLYIHIYITIFLLYVQKQQEENLIMNDDVDYNFLNSNLFIFLQYDD